jgi:5-methylcytosine-specific restriction endonuclease McrA
MTYIPVDLRQRIYALSGGCCEYCRIPQSVGTANFHIEHIIATSHNGKTTEGNLAYSCLRCNLYKDTNIAAADPETNEATFLYSPAQPIMG